MSSLQKLTYRAWFAIAAAGMPASVLAQSFGGPVPSVPGTPAANGTSATNVRAFAQNLIILVLNFLALIAVIYIIIAGIRLIVSQGEDEQKAKAKKTIMYVVIGLIVIILARIIVGVVTNTVPQAINNPNSIN